MNLQRQILSAWADYVDEVTTILHGRARQSLPLYWLGVFHGLSRCAAMERDYEASKLATLCAHLTRPSAWETWTSSTGD